MPPRVNCFILADAAQESGGKLYVMGGGWDRLTLGSVPGTLQAASLAMLFEVDWNDANQPISMQIELVDEDQNPVLPEPIQFEFTVGRPPHVKPGTPILVPLTLNVAQVPIQRTGGHVFILRCEDVEIARARFTVVAARS